MTSILVHYSELALKGKNRPWFISRLVRNILQTLSGLGVREIRTPMGRIEIRIDDHTNMAEVKKRLSRVFGVANFAEAHRLPLDVDGMASAIIERLSPREAVTSFRVHVRRADRMFPTPSMELARELGSRIWYAREWKVDLERADLVVTVEIVPHAAYCYIGREAGAGGLPTGTGGRLVALLSGGIDSPVAAWRMMKRGCDVTLVHFHSVPYLPAASQEKVRTLAGILTPYQLRSRLFMVAFGDLQRQVTMTVPGDMRVIVYRRLMLRIAERIARRVRAKGLITGDVLGQVASQTIDNLAMIDAAATLPVYRPLIGLDKDEIIGQAQRLGTYDISILPDADTCTLFTPRHPETHARRYQVDEAEKGLAIDEMVKAAAAAAPLENFVYPS
jgi:thiamine biosynthesis protein ThiI